MDITRFSFYNLLLFSKIEKISPIQIMMSLYMNWNLQ